MNRSQSMERTMSKCPFEVPFSELKQNPDPYVASVFSCLESDFLTLPKGNGFVEYAVFEQGYEALKRSTSAFTDISEDTVYSAVVATPISIIVLRSMLGFTPPEWAYLASQKTGVNVPQNFARTLDRDVRLSPLAPLAIAGVKAERLHALVKVACQSLVEGAQEVDEGKIHRLDKADTKSGIEGCRRLATMGVPYAMLLYERFLGGPFAGHRDSVSELIGDCMESAIEAVLTDAGISYRKTKRAERIPGFDQAPDFIIPSEYNPQVVIEAKIAEDDGTARDKVTRIQHLAELSQEGQPAGKRKFEVVSCLAGRGFCVRREDMKKVLLATKGKVFTFKTLNGLIEHTRLKDFKTK